MKASDGITSVRLAKHSLLLAVILFFVMVGLVLGGYVDGLSFALSLGAIAILLLIAGVVIPRYEDVSEVSTKLSKEGVELLTKMEVIQKDVYAKTAELKQLAEKVGELTTFNIMHLGRFGPSNLEEVLLQERDRLERMLRDAGLEATRVQEIIAPITQTVTGDLARHVWAAVPKEIFTTGGPAAGQDMKAVGQWIVDSLLKSQVGAAADSVHQRMVDLGGWTSDVEIRIREFEKLRRTGELPDRVKKEVT